MSSPIRVFGQQASLSATVLQQAQARLLQLTEALSVELVV